jgi:uncharacterized protein (UPF0332 family)
MDRKARENLAAARALLSLEDACPNAAASRAYYAAYHACWFVMNERGIDTPEVRAGDRYFPHKDLPDEALQVGILNEQASKDLSWLRDQRVLADYFEEELTVEQVDEDVKTAEAFVQRLIGEPEYGE